MRSAYTVCIALCIALLLMVSLTAPALAKSVVIQASAPLDDHSEKSIKTAVKSAVENAVQQAIAMGLRWIQAGNAYLLDDTVVVRILATDREAEPNPDVEPGTGRNPDQPVRFDL